MKKLFYVFALSLLVTPFASAQFDEMMPPSGNITTESVTVINASQDNQDALSVGARPGDILRFEYRVESETGVSNFVPMVSLGDFSGATITDPGLGAFDAGNLVFPMIENGVPPLQESYTFFARVNEQCGGQTMLNVTPQGGNPITVNLTECAQTGGEGSCYGPNGCGTDLPSTGPQTTVISIILGVLGIFLVGFLLGRRV